MVTPLLLIASYGLIWPHLYGVPKVIAVIHISLPTTSSFLPSHPPNSILSPPLVARKPVESPLLLQGRKTSPVHPHLGHFPSMHNSVACTAPLHLRCLSRYPISHHPICRDVLGCNLSPQEYSMGSQLNLFYAIKPLTASPNFSSIH